MLFAELSSGEGRNDCDLSAEDRRVGRGEAGVRQSALAFSLTGSGLLCIRREERALALAAAADRPWRAAFPECRRGVLRIAGVVPRQQAGRLYGECAGAAGSDLDVRLWTRRKPRRLTAEAYPRRAPCRPMAASSSRCRQAATVPCCRLAGGTPRSVGELQNGEAVVRWSGDGRYLFLRQPEGDAVKISRLDIATGQKEPWRTLKVPEPGAVFVGVVALSADGKACAFLVSARSRQPLLGDGPEVRTCRDFC
jgi:hypothetical protein